MELHSEYFVIGRVNNSNYPLLSSTENAYYEEEFEFIEDPEVIEYDLGAPVPSKPVMADYHSSPYTVVSQKIHDVLAKFNMEGIQLIPAKITGKKGELYENYWFVNIYNILPVLDREKAVYTWNDFLEIANPIEKLVLNDEALKQYPLEERLVFVIEENNTFQLYHKSVVDAIMATNPEGILFTPANEWNIGTPFGK